MRARSIISSICTLFLLCLIISALMAVPLTVPVYVMLEPPSEMPFQKFSSYDELKNFVETAQQQTPVLCERSGNSVAPTFAAPSEGYGAAQLSTDYSTTNIQVEGVDEADIVKTDGEYIYTVSDKNIFIVKAWPVNTSAVTAKISLNATIEGIFLNENKLVVFVQSSVRDYYEYYEYSQYGTWFYKPLTTIKVYDITDKSQPFLVRNISINGTYFESRMIGKYVYAVVEQPIYSGSGDVILPQISHNNKMITVNATTIYYTNVSDYSYMFTTIISVDLQSNDSVPQHETFLMGCGRSTMYVSANNLYIAFYKSYRPAGYAYSTTGTLLYKIQLTDGKIKPAAYGAVPGRLLNQFSMDEHDEYFRVATTTFAYRKSWRTTAESRNHIYVLDMNLNIVGRLENLAKDERIYSARFMGDRCYLVTFKKVDPFFVIDLKNPFAPKVLGELKITGYSDYLHPFAENCIVGIGKETIAAEEGDFAWYQGVKISLFDVTDVNNPKEIAKYEIGDRGTDSPVLNDHKALLIDKSKSILVIPVLVAEKDESIDTAPNIRGRYVWQGAYVFTITVNSLCLKGKITHFDGNFDISYRYYYRDAPLFVKRTLYIEDVLYTISEMKIKMNSLHDLCELNYVVLNSTVG